MSMIKKYGKIWDTRCIDKKCSKTKDYEESNSRRGERKSERKSSRSSELKSERKTKSSRKSNEKIVVLDLDETLIHTFENQKEIDEFVKKHYPKIYEHVNKCVAEKKSERKSERKSTRKKSVPKRSEEDEFYAKKHDLDDVIMSDIDTNYNNEYSEMTENIVFETEPHTCPLMESGNELALINRLFCFDFKGKKNWAIKRPYLDSFLDYLFEHFDQVILWSAGIHDYVHAVVDVVFEKRKPHKVYTRDDCTEKNGSKSHKPLSKIAENDKELKNIFLVDNLPENSLSNKQNHFYIPDYDPENPKLTKYNLEYIETSLFKVQDFMEKYLFPKSKAKTPKDFKEVIPMSKTLYKSSGHIFDSI